MNTLQRPVKIFYTGATGYIGGALLVKLLEPSQKGKWDITALVRTEAAAKKLQELGVTPLIGNLDDSELLTREATAADVVLHTAHSDHVPAAQALVKGLSSGGKRRILIHTSGTGELADDSRGDYTTDKIYSDLDMETIHAIPITQIHKDVDSYIFDHCDGFESIIVAPPTIYGLGNGPFNRQSIQVPDMIKAFIKYGYAATLGKGINVWSHIHIEDLADFYILLLEKALEGKASIGKDGWYFVESGEHYLRDLVVKIGEELYKQGAIKQAEPVQFKEGEPEKYFGDQNVWTVIASNSRARSDRARALGWKPKRETIFESIEAEVKFILAQQKSSN